MMTSVATIRQSSGAGEPVPVSAQARRQAARSHGATSSKLAASAALIALAALSALPAWAADEHHTVVPVEDVTWSPGPLKFPAGYDVPAHWHSKEEQVTVIAGGFGMGTGEALDRDAAPLLAPGSFVRIPARMPHYAWTDQETVVQINGVGPFDITYINPKGAR